MMFSRVEEIELKHYNAPSNLSVEDVNVLLKTISEAEIAEDDQYRVSRKYRVALEEAYGLAETHGCNEIKDSIGKVLWDE